MLWELQELLQESFSLTCKKPCILPRRLFPLEGHRTNCTTMPTATHKPGCAHRSTPSSPQCLKTPLTAPWGLRNSHQLSVCSSPPWGERYANLSASCTGGVCWGWLSWPESSIKECQTLRDNHEQTKVFKIAVCCSPTPKAPGALGTYRPISISEHPTQRLQGSQAWEVSTQIQPKPHRVRTAKHVASLLASPSCKCPPKMVTKLLLAQNTDVLGASLSEHEPTWSTYPER